MAKASITTDLSLAIQALTRFTPYSTHPEHRAWKAALMNLRGVEAILITIEAYAPGRLRLLESAAIEELQVVHEDPIPEISDLVERYSKKREPMR